MLIFIMSLNQIEACSKFIKQFEGFSSVPYKCPAGFWTIGHGHQLENTPQKTKITEDEAFNLLKKDVSGALSSLKKMVKVPLNENETIALCSLVFNLGHVKFSKLTLLKKLNGSYPRQEVAKEFLDIVYAGNPKKKLNGLVIRRQAEYNLFLKPDVSNNDSQIKDKSTLSSLTEIIKLLVRIFSKND